MVAVQGGAVVGWRVRTVSLLGPLLVGLLMWRISGMVNVPNVCCLAMRSILFWCSSTNVKSPVAIWNMRVGEMLRFTSLWRVS